MTDNHVVLRKIDLGEYEIVQIKNNVISIHLGNSIHTHIHLFQGLSCTLSPGDKIHLFTELPCHLSTN